MPPGASGGCNGTSVRGPWELYPDTNPNGGERRLYRGPYCPSSQFFMVHRLDLDLVLRSFDLWREAFDAARWPDLVTRWETTTCSLLAADEVVVAPKFLWALKRVPWIWRRRFCPALLRGERSGAGRA